MDDITYQNSELEKALMVLLPLCSKFSCLVAAIVRAVIICEFIVFFLQYVIE